MKDQDLINEIKEILSSKIDDKDASTIDDLVETTGFSQNKIRKILKELKNKDLLESIVVYRENINGVLSQRPAYRLRHSSKIGTG